MRPARTICLFCRSRSIARVSTVVHRPQWQITDQYTTASGGINLSAPAGQLTLNKEVIAEESQPQSSTAIDSPEIPTSQTDGPRSRRQKWDLKPKAKGDKALKMFQSILNEQQSGDLEGTTSSPPQASLQLYEDTAKLLDMKTQPGVTVSERFKFFYTQVFPQLKKKNEISTMFKNEVEQLLAEVAEKKKKDFSRDMPTITQITQVQRQLGMLRKPKQWAPLILDLISRICSMNDAEAFSNLEPGRRSLTAREYLLHDLVQAWRVFCLPDHLVSSLEILARPKSHFRLPPLDLAVLRKDKRKGNSSLSLAAMFPRYAPNQLSDLQPAVIATFVLLTDTVKTPPSVRPSAKEFVNHIGKILAIVPVQEKTLQHMFPLDQTLSDYVQSRWPTKAALHQTNDEPRLGLQATESQEPTSSLRTIHQQLSRALKYRDLSLCETAWAKFWGQQAVPDAKKAKELQQNQEMFDYFIMVYTTMRQAKRAHEVWQSMTAVNIRPTLKTWTSFLEGCKKASNAGGIQTAWENLTKSGVQLDTAIWTARISGLIHAGEVGAGLAALEEMRMLSEQSQRGPSFSPPAVKLTIEPVNAAIDGLLRKNGGLPAAKKVLAWAGNHDIKPDIVTFNTLLRPLVREGVDDEVSEVLDTMRKQNVHADEATFTVLIEGALTFNGHQSSENQVQIVDGILSKMETVGLEANSQTYAKMIFLLLQGSDHAQEAVKAVLVHMWQKGIKTSSHICTMLAEHYFSRDPPDLEAVRQLIESQQDFKGGQSFDRVFWERVVRGYAQAADTGNAMKYFEKIANSLSVTSSTLEDLLRALIADAKWDEASKLVRRVKAQRLLTQGSTGDAQARSWRHRFWHLAVRNGLLDQGSLEELD